MINSFVFVLISYLIGAIPFGIVIGWIAKSKDIRKLGTGNAGASNTFLVIGPFAAILTAILDISKGFFLVYLAWIVFNDEIMVSLTGIAVICGHIWPIFFAFKGGKGIATVFGVFLFLSWQSVVLALICWLIIVILWQYVALTNVIACMLMPVFCLFFNLPIEYICFAAIVSLLMIYSHRTNIKKYFKGEELSFLEIIKKSN